MARHYSPNHPAVRHYRQNGITRRSGRELRRVYDPTGPVPFPKEPRPSVRERTAAVRARRGIPEPEPRTGTRTVIGLSTFVLAVGITEQYPLIGFALMSVTYAAAWPWIMETVREVRSWRR